MERTEAFVSALKGLDRGACAELRRSLSFDPGTYPAAYPYVEHFVARDFERQAFYLVAGLYALHERAGAVHVGRSPGSGRGPTLGSAVGALYEKQERRPSIERRFLVLLDADSDQVPHRLRQMVTLLASDGIPIQWGQLLKDLLAWRHERRYVQQRWAREFYRSTVEPDHTATLGE